jgi:hypothetical protein
MKLKRISAHAYHGRRGGVSLGVMPGAEVELPDEVAAALLKDFPQDWEPVGGGRDREERDAARPRAAERRPPASSMAHEQAPAPAPPAAKPRRKWSRG